MTLVSFFQVAAKALEAAAYGAYYNVTINLRDITDEPFIAAVSVPSSCRVPVKRL